MATIPLSAFRVSEGKLAITFDLRDLPCWTAVLAVDNIETVLLCTEEALELHAADRNVVKHHIRLRKMLCEACAAPDMEKNSLVGLGLWLALNNPLGADEFRKAISHELRQKGKAQLIIGCDDRGKWAFAISDRPSELGAMMATVPDELFGLMLRTDDAATNDLLS